MFKETSLFHFVSLMLSALLLLIVFPGQKLFSQPKPEREFAARVSALQKGPQPVTGAPLKGVDVKLARYGGAQFAGGMTSLKRTTDEAGKFTFGVLPAGSYSLTISLSKETDKVGEKEKHEMNKSIIQNIKAREANQPADLKTCLITISGSANGAIIAGWDFKTGKSFDPNANATAKSGRASFAEEIEVKSDGKNPLNGTIIKSKSNITNN
jgi:hypothetical protein